MSRLGGRADAEQLTQWHTPPPQTIAALPALGAATSAQQVKIHPVASSSPEDYPHTMPWCRDEGGWPLGTMLGIPHSIFAATFPVFWVQDLTGINIDGLCWGVLGL